MNYIPLSEYKKAWIFRHRDLPLSAEDLEQIKPMTEKRAAEVWTQNVSRQSTHYTHFCKGDWAGQGNTWEASGSWQGAWDSDDMALPEELADEATDEASGGHAGHGAGSLGRDSHV